MKKEITHNEWWPVLELDEPVDQNSPFATEIPDELVRRHEAALAEFRAVQNILIDLDVD